MQHDDFHIGLEFISSSGGRWRCTDVGSRTIVAIRLQYGEPQWYLGPPYIADEEVFDEHEIKCCHLNECGAMKWAVDNLRTSGHPGYPSEVVGQMLSLRRSQGSQGYPRPRVLRFDRRRHDGELLHPFAGTREDGGWIIELYLPFLKNYHRMAEGEFIVLPLATDRDIRARADQLHEYRV